MAARKWQSPDSRAHGLSTAPKLTQRFLEIIQEGRNGNGTNTTCVMLRKKYPVSRKACARSRKKHIGLRGLGLEK